ncbi:hypothetical protein [Streptomyces rugosispiralis]|uniref:Uncharacterized protein n=1 Tax=Streptomyces rugosispiralis TaxID=2967341 RepID=A0ABT1V969_9ACTN|nr:hypothetical protein [Streptomyces rugosispiralis]MCQ8193836.1 hypothetical protein [Streptomyces rugosispiralis]
MTPEGLWEAALGQSSARLDNWYGQISAQAEQGRPIMSREEYVRHYLGRHSVGLRGEAQRWDGAADVHDAEAAIRETGVGRWAEFPICEAVVPEGAQDARQALCDHLTWSAITAYSLGWRLSDATGAAGRHLGGPDRDQSAAVHGPGPFHARQPLLLPRRRRCPPRGTPHRGALAGRRLVGTPARWREV